MLCKEMMERLRLLSFEGRSLSGESMTELCEVAKADAEVNKEQLPIVRDLGVLAAKGGGLTVTAISERD